MQWVNVACMCDRNFILLNICHRLISHFVNTDTHGPVASVIFKIFVACYILHMVYIITMFLSVNVGVESL